MVSSCNEKNPRIFHTVEIPWNIRGEVQIIENIPETAHCIPILDIAMPLIVVDGFSELRRSFTHLVASNIDRGSTLTDVELRDTALCSVLDLRPSTSNSVSLSASFIAGHAGILRHPDTLSQPHSIREDDEIWPSRLEATSSSTSGYSA